MATKTSTEDLSPSIRRILSIIPDFTALLIVASALLSGILSAEAREIKRAEPSNSRAHAVQCPSRIVAGAVFKLEYANFIDADIPLGEEYLPGGPRYAHRADMIPDFETGLIFNKGFEGLLKTSGRPQLLCKYLNQSVAIPLDIPRTVNACWEAGYCD